MDIVHPCMDGLDVHKRQVTVVQPGQKYGRSAGIQGGVKRPRTRRRKLMGHRFYAGEVGALGAPTGGRQRPASRLGRPQPDASGPRHPVARSELPILYATDATGPVVHPGWTSVAMPAARRAAVVTGFSLAAHATSQ